VRVFLDTNVLVSAFGTRGLCAEVLTLVLAEHELVLGEQLLGELERVLRQKMRVPAKRTAEVLAFLRSRGSVSAAIAPGLIKVRDPSDAKILGEAVAGDAEILVTGDKDLLDVAAKAPFPIVTPRGFWEQLRGDQTK
jgi:putative PIN family toxin of toxin-antitoxin system